MGQRPSLCVTVILVNQTVPFTRGVHGQMTEGVALQTTQPKVQSLTWTQSAASAPRSSRCEYPRASGRP